MQSHSSEFMRSTPEWQMQNKKRNIVVSPENSDKLPSPLENQFGNIPLDFDTEEGDKDASSTENNADPMEDTNFNTDKKSSIIRKRW